MATTSMHLPRPAAGSALRAATAAAVALLLLFGLIGGLQRAGALPWTKVTAPAAIGHGALMIGGWLGSVIAIERAVALGTGLSRLVPVLSIAGGAVLVAGAPGLAAPLLVLASALFVAVHLQLWRRQRELHHAVLGAGALAWLAGNLAWWARGAAAGDGATIAWFAFLVLTIAAERLELTRLTRRSPAALRVFAALAAGITAAALLAAGGWPGAGASFGALLLGLAAWLARHDIARFTVRLPGLPGYIALALWCGYAWLAVAGAAWLALAAGLGGHDAALHALGLGFVLSMVMAHAPVILPAVARVRLAFGLAFYGPLALLQLSVAVRLGLDLRAGAWLHLAALATFVLTLALALRRAARRP